MNSLICKHWKRIVDSEQGFTHEFCRNKRVVCACEGKENFCVFGLHESTKIAALKILHNICTLSWTNRQQKALEYAINCVKIVDNLPSKEEIHKIIATPGTSFNTDAEAVYNRIKDGE